MKKLILPPAPLAAADVALAPQLAELGARPGRRGRLVRKGVAMKGRVMLAFVVGAAATALLAFSGGAFADPPDTLISPPNHRHFVVTPSGPVPVGPQICGNPNLQQAFNEFHYNVHHSEVPGIGDIPTLGPQDGAPGLNNDQGGEILGVRGCG